MLPVLPLLPRLQSASLLAKWNTSNILNVASLVRMLLTYVANVCRLRCLLPVCLTERSAAYACICVSTVREGANERARVCVCVCVLLLPLRGRLATS